MPTGYRRLVGALMLVFCADAVAAQSAVLVRREPPNRCAERHAGPSPVADNPDGIILLRLRDELGAAQRLVIQLPPGRHPALQEERQRLFRLQRELDSALAALARGTAGPLPLRSWRPQVDDRIDVLERVLVALRAAPPSASSVADAPRDEPAAAATGYLGLTLSGAQLRLLEPDGVWVSHCEYPVVEAVDPGSPAARAGVQAGDTLVAFNSIDLRARAVSYPALLLPGTTLRLHLRRAGDVRVRAVVVAPRGDAPDDPRR
jgi:hypothetical protein